MLSLSVGRMRWRIEAKAGENIKQPNVKFQPIGLQSSRSFLISRYIRQGAFAFFPNSRKFFHERVSLVYPFLHIQEPSLANNRLIANQALSIVSLVVGRTKYANLPWGTCYQRSSRADPLGRYLRKVQTSWTKIHNHWNSGPAHTSGTP